MCITEFLRCIYRCLLSPFYFYFYISRIFDFLHCFFTFLPSFNSCFTFLHVFYTFSVNCMWQITDIFFIYNLSRFLFRKQAPLYRKGLNLKGMINFTHSFSFSYIFSSFLPLLSLIYFLLQRKLQKSCFHVRIRFYWSLGNAINKTSKRIGEEKRNNAKLIEGGLFVHVNLFDFTVKF